MGGRVVCLVLVIAACENAPDRQATVKADPPPVPARSAVAPPAPTPTVEPAKRTYGHEPEFPLEIQDRFYSVAAAMRGRTFVDHPSPPKMQPEGSDRPRNPSTDRILSHVAGNPYVCCEGTATTAWLDPVENVLWIKASSANMRSAHTQWYGPFAIDE